MLNNIIKNKITIIIANYNSIGNFINITINNFRQTYQDANIIVISQEDNEPFMKGQLYNIAFKYIRTEYVLFVDNVYNFNKINLIETYKKINHPYLGYNNIKYLGLKYNDEIEDISIESDNSNKGLFIFMHYNDFVNCGGYSNLCFSNENIILDYKLNHFKYIKNNIGYIGNPYREINKQNNVLDIYKSNNIEFKEDGYNQTLYDIVYDYYTKDHIRYLGVNNIRVKEDYKYLDLYNKYLNEIKDNIKNNKKKDIGVSICITAYQVKDTIKDTLDSVIRQTWFQKYNNWEILLGIDGCRDTLNYVSRIMNNYKNLRVFIMNSNKGTYVTTNTLMKIAKYENIIRFDADDIMCPNLVETLMEKAKDYDFIRFRFAYMRNKWKTTHNTFGQHLIKKSIFEKFGGYRPWKCAADYDLYVRLFYQANQVILKDKYLFYYRTDDNSLTHSPETGLKSEYRQELHDFIKSQDYTKEENTKIECVTNTYKEIFSNIYDYYPDNYMYLMTLNNDWPNIC